MQSVQPKFKDCAYDHDKHPGDLRAWIILIGNLVRSIEFALSSASHWSFSWIRSWAEQTARITPNQLFLKTQDYVYLLHQHRKSPTSLKPRLGRPPPTSYRIYSRKCFQWFTATSILNLNNLMLCSTLLYALSSRGECSKSSVSFVGQMLATLSLSSLYGNTQISPHLTGG